MGSRSLLLGLLLVAAAALFILLPREEAADSVGSGEAEPAASGSATGAALDPEAGAATGGTAATREEVQPAASDPDGAQTQAFLPSSTAADALVVRCVARDGGAPLAGATVYHMEQGAMSEETMMLAWTSNASIADVMLRFADRYLTDEQGEVRVPWSEDLGVAARHEGMFQMAQTWEHDPSDPLVLELYVQPTLAVKVVDERGDALPQASVTLRYLSGDWRLDLLRQDTDAEGLAVFRDFDLLSQSFKMESLHVGLGEALLAPLEVPIPTEALESGADPVVLVMPPTGVVEVEVQDSAGQPVRDNVLVVLTPYDEESEPGDDGFSGGDGRTSYATTVDGVARFDYVGLGQELSAGAYPSGPGTPSVVDGRGPARGDETVRLLVEEDASLPVLIGTVTHEGQPLAGEVVRFKVVTRYLDGDSWDEERNVSLDENGSFRMNLGRHEEEVAAMEVLVRRVPGEEPLYAQATLPVGFRGQHDLGTLALQPAPLLASGRVIAPDGSGLEGARVSLQRGERWGDDDGDIHWEGTRVHVMSGAAGAFTVAHAVPREVELRLVTSHPAYLKSVTAVKPGRTGLEIRLGEAFEVLGNVLLDEGFPPDALEVSLEYTSELSEVWEDLSWGKMQPDGSFHFGQLPPGTVRLAVESADSELRLHVVDGIRVGPGLAQDPRLKDIDLRGLVFRHVVKVTDAKGTPLPEVMGVVRGEEAVWHWGSGGELAFVSTDRSVDLDVHAEGYRSAAVLALSGSREIQLGAGIEVRVRWSGPRARFENCTWGVRLSPLENPGSMAWIGGGEAALDENGEATIVLGVPGPYALCATLHHAESWNQVDVEGTVEIEVLETGNPVFLISGTAEQIDKAYQAAKAPPNLSSSLEGLGYVEEEEL